MALVATPGAANANSYATVAELDTYAATRPGAPAWFATAATADKEAALIMATRMLDGRLNWTGAPTTPATQALGWPRTGMLNRNSYAIDSAVLPLGLVEATCEQALQMGGTGNGLADNDPINQGITSVKAGSVAVTFKEIDESTPESADVQFRKKEQELAWASVPDSVRALLVPSWYTTEGVARPLMFDFIC